MSLLKKETTLLKLPYNYTKAFKKHSIRKKRNMNKKITRRNRLIVLFQQLLLPADNLCWVNRSFREEMALISPWLVKIGVADKNR